MSAVKLPPIVDQVSDLFVVEAGVPLPLDAVRAAKVRAALEAISDEEDRIQAVEELLKLANALEETFHGPQAAQGLRRLLEEVAEPILTMQEMERRGEDLARKRRTWDDFGAPLRMCGKPLLLDSSKAVPLESLMKAPRWIRG